MSSTELFQKKLEIGSVILPTVIVKYVNECLQSRVNWETQETEQDQSCKLPKIWMKWVGDTAPQL